MYQKDHDYCDVDYCVGPQFLLTVHGFGVLGLGASDCVTLLFVGVVEGGYLGCIGLWFSIVEGTAVRKPETS